MTEAVIVAACRTAVGKAPRGRLRGSRPDDLAALCLAEAVARTGGLQTSDVDEVILGCAYPEGAQGTNVARIAALRAGFPVDVAALTINRFCASGLEAIAIASQRIAAGGAEVIVAGGVESMSQIPRGGHRPSPNPALIETYPDVYLSMGLTAERIQRRYGISREAQDQFACDSQRKAAAAIEEKRFVSEIVPVTLTTERIVEGRRVHEEVLFEIDEGVRAGTTLESLGKLKPAFHVKGTVTAGNSSQTSDGAAAVVVMSAERARSLGLSSMGRLIGYSVAGCAPEIMGMGPVYAIPKALDRAGLSMDSLDLIELNEAFAVQALAVMKESELSADRVNVSGGAIALGHPLGATGAKLTTSLLYELSRRQGRYGMVTMCIGGGMGAAGVFERG